MGWQTLCTGAVVVVLSTTSAFDAGKGRVEELIQIATTPMFTDLERERAVKKLDALAAAEPTLCPELVVAYWRCYVYPCPLAAMFESDSHPCGKDLVEILRRLRAEGKERDTPEVYGLLNEDLLRQNREFVEKTILEDRGIRYYDSVRAGYVVLAIRKHGVTTLADVIAEAVTTGQDLSAPAPGTSSRYTYRGDLYARALLDLRNTDNADVVDTAVMSIYEWALQLLSSGEGDKAILSSLVEVIEESFRRP